MWHSFLIWHKEQQLYVCKTVDGSGKREQEILDRGKIKQEYAGYIICEVHSDDLVGYHELLVLPRVALECDSKLSEKRIEFTGG